MFTITVCFFISIFYSFLVLFCAQRTGLTEYPAAKSSLHERPSLMHRVLHAACSRIKCDFFSCPAYWLEAGIFGLSVYLHLLLGILTADGDSAYFVHVITHFIESDAPFAGIYANSGITYPPLFQYLYYILAQIIRLLHIPVSTTCEAFILTVKLPGIFCEFFMAWLLYRSAAKKWKHKQTVPLLLLTLLNPAYLFVTAYICQIDALYVCLLFITVLLICENRLKLSYAAFAAAVLCKYQAIFITPVVLFATFRHVWLNDFSWKKFWTHAAAGFSAIFCMFLSYLPFVWNISAGCFYNGGLTGNFTRSIQSYGWASQNTYNFWNLFGYNFRSEELFFGPLCCADWGTLFIILLVLLSAVHFWQHKNDRRTDPLIGAVLVSGTVCFATRMMPRYLYAAVPLLILGFVQKPTWKRLFCAVGFSVLFFLLTVFDYVVYPVFAYSPNLVLPKLLSVLFLGTFVYLNGVLFCEKRSGFFEK